MEETIDKAAEITAQLQKIRDFLRHNDAIVEELKHILKLAKDTCNKPISIISLSEDGSSWLNSSSEIELKLNDAELTFCRAAITTDEPVIIEDTTNLSRAFTLEIPENTKIRFYAGVALTTNDGIKIGTLCLIDVKANHLDHIQLRILKSLAQQIMYVIESRMVEKELNKRLQELEEKNQSLRAIAQLQSHEIRQPFSSVLGLLNLAEIDAVVMDKTWLKMITDVAKILDTKIRSVVHEATGTTDIKLFRYNNMVGEIEDYAILLLDIQGNVENWNKGAEKIKGYKTSEIVGRNFSIFYNNQQQMERLPQQMLETARKFGVARDEGYRTRKDNTEFMARVVITAVHNERKEIVGFTKVTRDITNEKPPIKVSA
ncbi:PAS domain-containing protein [Pedobacter xixiisoli]|uniref:PAS domain S-box-containing protein n=1 Tax=Pedobacter xixiisoli TaxID=1476464 RepID=A0A286AEE2_9SPHI|nr:PAS domain S-box protein [Pedobacter xixiisoli]SOD20265.1 PAS domain S-box-containing protein [Pedobacter xixiisoli]